MLRDARLRMVALLCVAALTVLGACSGDPASVADDASNGASADNDPTPSPVEETDDAPSPSPEEESEEEATGNLTFEVWFAKGRRLAPAFVTEEATPRVGSAALEALFAGPPSGEAKVYSAIPRDTRLNGLAIKGGTATVDLSSAYESGGGTASMGMRLGQVTFTLTQFPTVKRVAFELDGEPVEIFSGEGLVIEKPLTRADFEDISPPIILSRPRANSEVQSPVTISGTANVFEATVSIRIVSATGEVLAETFTTATCGSGCRGGYSEPVDLDVEEPTEATILVFEQSAEDGSERFPVEVPVTLLP
ncbi:MAG: Gmad2 immunoglobulin-like domain-containing protein [Actinomycetota bacterium]